MKPKKLTENDIETLLKVIKKYLLGTPDWTGTITISRFSLGGSKETEVKLSFLDQFAVAFD